MEDTSKELKHIELSEQYYKSRKQLMLYSGLFFIYEFIGVKVPTKPFPNSEVELLSPQAVPIVLFLLVIYFLYRLLLGWNLSNEQVRKSKVSKFDFYPSFLVAFISILLFVYQSISKIQIADLISTNTPSETFTVIINLILVLSPQLILHKWMFYSFPKTNSLLFYLILFIITVIILLISVLYIMGFIPLPFLFIYCFYGLLFSLVRIKKYRDVFIFFANKISGKD